MNDDVDAGAREADPPSITHSAKSFDFTVEGWAIDPSDPTARVRVDLYVDDILIVHRTATRPRRRVGRQFGTDGRHGFKLFLPPSCLDGREHKVVVVRADTGERILEVRRVWPSLPHAGDGSVGLVSQVTSRSVRGWAMQSEDAFNPRDVVLWVDGERIAVHPAADHNGELPLWDDATNHGFEIRIPGRFYDDQVHLIEVRHPDGVALALGCQNAVLLPKEQRVRWKSDARVSDGVFSATIQAQDGAEGSSQVSFFSGDSLLGTKAFKSNIPFSVNLLGLLPLTIKGRLRVELDGDDHAVTGDEPFGKLVSLVEARRVDHGVEARLMIHPPADAEVDFVFLADDVPVHRARHRFERSRPVATFVVATPEDLERFDVQLPDGRDVSAATAFDPGGPEGRGAQVDDGLWKFVSENASNVRIIKGGLHAAAEPMTYSGHWRLSKDGRSIQGWALRLDEPLRPLKIALHINGRATEIAYTGSDSSQDRFAFSFDLAPYLLEEGPIGANVRVNDDLILGDAPGVLVRKDQRYSAGFLSASWKDFTLTVSGWVHDHERPQLPTRVRLRRSDVVLAQATALKTATIDFVEGVSIRVLLFTITHDLLTRDASHLSIDVGESGARWAAPPVGEVGTTDPQLVSEPEPPIAVNANELVVGSLDEASMTRVQGWAYVPAQVSAPVDLILSVEGEPFSHTRTRSRRADVERRLGISGFFGYSFEMPANIGWTSPIQLGLTPAVGRAQIKRSNHVLPPFQSGCAEAMSTADPQRPQRKTPKRTFEKVSAVLLNQNGAGLLRDFFASVSAHEPSGTEWIVIDHGSNDDSSTACSEAVDAGLDVKFVQRSGNFSFSASNNYGATLASGDVLLFINNDIVLVEPIIAALIDSVSDDGVGIAGIKLFDAAPEPNSGIIQHLGVFFDPVLNNGEYRPFEARRVPEVEGLLDGVILAPAATGALFAMRKEDFEAVGGFDETYFYGYEDVDLCMKVNLRLGKAVASLNGHGAVHHRGFTRQDGKHQDPRRTLNRMTFTRTWGAVLRKLFREDLLTRPSFWFGHRPIIGFAVSEADDSTSAGDYFTALELGTALQAEAPVHIRYLPRADWYDLSGVDILIVMVDGFDARRIKTARPHLKLIAWARNWFDRWADNPSIYAFDQVWSSSDTASRFMNASLELPVTTVRIATNPERFSKGQPSEELASDYCFTGSRFGVARDIEFSLNPAAVSGVGKVFGHNWSGHTLQALSQGDLPYARMPDVYASTKVVVDDANVATRQWGSVNSRVFDALGAGRLVVTNGDIGAEEVFGDALPTWSNEGELTAALNAALSDPVERERLTTKLRTEVLANHTYAARAEQVLSLLKQPASGVRIAIKTPAETAREREWGDFHFANSLASALRRLGHVVRVDNREHWYGGLAAADDVVIVLRGLIPYKPATHQTNYLWLISHPEDLPTKELEGYDRVYVASKMYASALAATTKTPVEVLLQCTDTARFKPPASAECHDHRLLFVGNSRAVFRDSVRWAIEANLEVAIFGAGWGAYLPENMIRGGHVPNAVLGELYSVSTFVLCDHWQEMRNFGFISNRIFDVLASGSEIISDEVLDMESVISSGVHVYRSREEFLTLCRTLEPEPYDVRARRAEWVLKNHTFERRAEIISQQILVDSQHLEEMLRKAKLNEQVSVHPN